MLQPDRTPLLDLTLASGTAGRVIADDAHCVPLDRLGTGSAIGSAVAGLQGRRVLLRTQAQLPSVLAMIELDGIAARLLLCPPDLAPEHLDAVMAEAEVDAIVTDGPDPVDAYGANLAVPCRSDLDQAAAPRPPDRVETEWVLFTSGTTGRPKMVRHTLHSLTGHLLPVKPGAGQTVWSTFYDVRRYGGLSILVRALLSRASMVLSSAGEPVGAFLQRVQAGGVTHMSGTPSHWRRALMSPALPGVALENVRMSGEIADQTLLDRVRHVLPGASVTHAFASTEAGVAFEVTDGLAGFPASMLEVHGLKADLRVENGTLRIRSARVAAGYVGRAPGVSDGFVDTGDLVERRGERYVFTGRREGVINVGGEKVYPEEIESVINSHPAVRVSLVWPRAAIRSWARSSRRTSCSSPAAALRSRRCGPR